MENETKNKKPTQKEGKRIAPAQMSFVQNLSQYSQGQEIFKIPKSPTAFKYLHPATDNDQSMDQNFSGIMTPKSREESFSKKVEEYKELSQSSKVKNDSDKVQGFCICGNISLPDTIMCESCNGKGDVQLEGNIYKK